MAKKKTINYDSKSISDKLKLIEEYKREDFLYPILEELFKKKGYTEVRINHGVSEYGKDVVFKHDAPDGSFWHACVVKNKSAGLL